MNRRQAIACALALAASPALAQQGRVWHIGFLVPSRRASAIAFTRYGAVIAGLRDLGYVEGKNFVVEWRYGDDAYERLPALAGELVKLNPDVIVSSGTPATRAAQRATSTIPIVMIGAGDPVGTGLVDSLARPGRNITGVSIQSADLGSKWFELARSIVPSLERVGLMLNTLNPAYASTLQSAWRAAKPTNTLVFPVEVRTVDDFERAFNQLTRAGVGALVIQNDGLFADSGRRLAELAIKAKLPTVGGRREATEAGFLISYGTNLPQSYRRAAVYLDKIFKGAKPGDLPVEQPTDFEMFVNMKTARALGITIPKEVLLRADKVIE